VRKSSNRNLRWWCAASARAALAFIGSPKHKNSLGVRCEKFALCCASPHIHSARCDGGQPRRRRGGEKLQRAADNRDRFVLLCWWRERIMANARIETRTWATRLNVGAGRRDSTRLTRHSKSSSCQTIARSLAGSLGGSARGGLEFRNSHTSVCR
jgi:hypothetical protein